MFCILMYVYVALQKTINYMQWTTHKIRRNTQKTHLMHKKQTVAQHIETPQGSIILPAKT